MAHLRDLLAAAAISVAATGCGLHRQTPLDAVPADAIAVVVLDWRAIARDPAFRSFADLPRLTAILDELRVSRDDVDTATLFATNFSQSDESALLESSRLAQRVSAGASSRGWRPQSISGYQVWTRSDGSAAAGMLTSDLVVIGPQSEVEAVLRSVTSGRTFARRHELEPIHSFLSEKETMAATIVWPTGARDQANFVRATSVGAFKLIGLPAIASIVGELGIGRGIALRCIRERGSIRMTVGGLMQEEMTASVVAGGLQLLRGLGGLVPQERNSEAGGMLSDMSVTRTGPFISVSMLVPESQFAH